MAAKLTGATKATGKKNPQPASTFAEIPVSRPKVEQRLLNLPASPTFLYKWHPDRWGVFGSEWLPILGKMNAEPGVAAVNKDGGLSLAKAEAERKGWRIIPEEAVRLVDPDRDTYVRAYKGRAGPVHLSIFEIPRQVGNRVVIKSDTDRYWEWLRALISEGYVDTPDEEVASTYVDAQRQRVERAVGANNPHRIEREEARLESMQAALLPGEEPTEDPEPEPSKRKPGRPKKKVD